MQALKTLRKNALEIISTMTRSEYARDVIRGAQRISGGDMEGKARKYGHTYAKYRALAASAVRKAGGMTVALPHHHGLLVFAAPACVDDFGTLVVDTDYGMIPVTEVRVH